MKNTNIKIISLLLIQLLRDANVDLMICFGSILKEKTFVFQNNAEQSKLTALNNNSKNAPNTQPFFGVEHEKHAKVLFVHWSFTSEVYCKILA